MRQFGQAKLPASFISRSSFVNQDPKPITSKKPITLSEFLNRKLGKTGGRLLKERPISIGSIGFDKKEGSGEKSEDGSSLMAKSAIFGQFSMALNGKEKFDLGDGAENEQQHSRKRKKPAEFSSDAGGHGWWDGDREGIDGEEVGCCEAWEGVGSTTLGGLDWH